MSVKSTDGQDEKKSKAKEFHGGLTAEVIICFAINLAIAVAVMVLGNHYNHMWKDQRGNVFIIFGAVLILLAVIAVRVVTNKVLRLSENSLYLKSGNNEFRCPWKNMRTFIPSRRKKKFFKSTIVGDNQRSVSIDSVSFKEYDNILTLMTTIRRRADERAQTIGQDL